MLGCLIAKSNNFQTKLVIFFTKLIHVPLFHPGIGVRTPRLAVVDMSAYIQTPKVHPYAPHRQRLRLARPPRPSHPRFTSDEYDTHESDS